MRFFPGITIPNTDHGRSLKCKIISLLQKTILYIYNCIHWNTVLKGLKNIVLPVKSLMVSLIDWTVRFRVRDGSVGNIMDLASVSSKKTIFLKVGEQWFCQLVLKFDQPVPCSNANKSSHIYLSLKINLVVSGISLKYINGKKTP